jgi:hypothetical protein
VNSGWAIRAADIPTRDLLVQRQSEWAEDLDANTVEANQKWHTYIVSNCPRGLTDLYGNTITDYDAAVREEVICQAGHTPVSIRLVRNDSANLPTKSLLVSFLQPITRPWSLFGTSWVAKLVKKAGSIRQCDNCWDYHSKHLCRRQQRCRHCGKLGHRADACNVKVQCTNCLGPHEANYENCPARPKRVNGRLRPLTAEQRSLIRQMGIQLYQQHTEQPSQQYETPDTHRTPSPPQQSPTSQDLASQHATLPSRDVSPSDDASSSDDASPLDDTSPSCIIVETDTTPGSSQTEPPKPPMKRQLRSNPAPSLSL